jgi:nucleotide-binding universal stress UspA family protein
MSGPQSILVPVDGSPPSLAALEHALVLAEDDLATRIDVLHVEAPRDVGGGMLRALSPDAREQIDQALVRAMESARARLGDRAQLVRVSGEPLRMILDTARTNGYDLIVIGTHGRMGRIASLLGSVAEGVVRNAGCPVLTVREPGEGYQSFAERRHRRTSVATVTAG